MKKLVMISVITLFATTAYAKGHHSHHYTHRTSHRVHSDSIVDKIAGFIEVLGEKFRFVSGGAGRGPIPYGDYEITPHEVGGWGAKHGALGLNHGDSIPDKKVKADREGIEIHEAPRDRTAGCIGIRDGYPKFKVLVNSILDKEGHAWIHIWPDKQAVTPTKDWPPKVAEAE